ncbi:MAG: flagellar biosynthesis protein FliQ [Planctomycetia bacterium]|nr:flagellar biosynthesis protein FliQ [Planctomycetia bacterium]
MSPDTAVDMAREAVMSMLLLSAPALIAGLAVGLLVGLLQSLTQIQEQTVSFVPKLVAIVATLSLTLPWLVQRLVQYSHDLIANIPQHL